MTFPAVDDMIRHPLAGLARCAAARTAVLRWRAGFLFSFALAAMSGGAVEPARNGNTLDLSPGASRTLRFDVDIGTALVADPETADVQVLDARSLFVLGRATGITSLQVHDQAGASLGAWTLRVQTETGFARAVAMRLAGEGADIQVDAIGGALVVTGTASTPAQAERVLRGVRTVASDMPVIDALALTMPAQVNLEVLISEVSSQVTEEFGIDWSVDFNPFEHPLRTWVTGTGIRLGSGASQIVPGLEQTIEFVSTLQDGTPVEGAQFTNEVNELLVQPAPLRGGDGGIVLSHAKEVNSSKYRLSTFLDALADNGLAVVHARPNLTAVSGQPAEFFSGLEIPIPSISGQGVVSTEYRETGVSLTFTPTVLDRDQISLVVQPRIREIASGGATIAGTAVPNINERSASTTVELGDGESIAIAGLYRRTRTGSDAGIPFLKDLPLWGGLFRQSTRREASVELIIVVTPRIVAAVPAVASEGGPMAARTAGAGAAQLANEFYY